MKIEWVNHASFVVEQGGVRLISDPWLQGTAFHDGWALLSEPRFGPEDFANITHLWLSHEHPDHFSPATLRSIPAEVRAGISVLFQATRDRKVVRFCQDLGFADVTELQPGEWYELNDSVRVMNRPVPDDDSWLAVESNGVRLLNLNDCVISRPEQARAIREEIGGAPDVLLTQFSYANWVGNRDDPESHRRHARAQLDRVMMQCAELEPRYVVPFASFVWFCHEENAYMNAEANTVHDADRRLREETTAQPVVLYPGDTWTVGQPHDSSGALERYGADYAGIPKRTLIKAEKVELAELTRLADQFREEIVARNGALKLRAMKALGQLKPAHIFITDHDVAAGFALDRGLRRSTRSREYCDIELSSEALAYCFRHLWGGNTLLINGRFQAPPGGNLEHFRRYLMLASFANHDKTIVDYGRWRAGDLMTRLLPR